MRRLKPYIILTVVIIFFSWNLLTYYVIVSKPPSNAGREVYDLHSRLDKLQAELQVHMEYNNQILREVHRFKKSYPERLFSAQIRNHSKLPVQDVTSRSNLVIPILVIACNRVTVSKCLDQLLKYRPSKEQFPIIVSQDCGHSTTADVIRSYGDKLTHIQHPDLSEITLPFKEKKFLGYHKISRHYKWALTQIFQVFNYSTTIIVEDDLNISPDFFEYFTAMYPLLNSDPTLWCISAWNDNGKENLIENNPELLHRTDFFPGLGWMLKRDLWLELAPTWPKAFWDDWMRNPQQRRDRACIRPEICRTSTFGKIGVSKGQFFEKHLKYIKLNTQFVPFTQMDMTYLLKENYDIKFIEWVYSSPLLSLSQVRSGARYEEKTVRIEYHSKTEFTSIAKNLGIMDDMKAGVPRAGYRGVATLMYNNRRVYVAPPSNWKKYDIV